MYLDDRRGELGELGLERGRKFGLRKLEDRLDCGRAGGAQAPLVLSMSALWWQDRAACRGELREYYNEKGKRTT